MAIGENMGAALQFYRTWEWPPDTISVWRLVVDTLGVLAREYGGPL
jgi:hypothetical protein